VEIAPGVHQVAIGEGHFPPPNVFFIAGTRRSAFVDTAFGRDEEVDAHLKLWESHGKPEVAGIVLTHRHGDHIGGAGRLRVATGGEIVCHTDEREPIERDLDGVRVGRPVEDGETIDLGGVTLELVHTPGHTMGSLCVYYREQGILFAGDTVLGNGTTSISPDHGDMALYIESLGRLGGYDTKLIGPGHGAVVDRPKDKLEALIEHRHSRERRVLGLIQRGCGTVDRLFGAIYARLDRRRHSSARGQLLSHLIKLEREGRVSRDSNGTYSPV
jgi:glyoxylase-like metal-dependent hydrolase (beta-lactamase superfamily II)